MARTRAPGPPGAGERAADRRAAQRARRIRRHAPSRAATWWPTTSSTAACPPPRRCAIRFEGASAAMAYAHTLAPGATAVTDVLVPLHAPASWTMPDGLARSGWADQAEAAAIQRWRRQRDRVTLTGPPAAADALATVKAQLGFILVNRAGPAIQPGARSYARSWIRDGALTGEALLRLGHVDAVREFLEWFAPYQYDERQDPLRGRPARRRPGARARLHRRVHLPGRRVLPLHRRPRLLPTHVAAGAGGDRLPRVAARHERRTPAYQAPGAARVLRHPAAVDQPRGLLGQAHALVLGRLLGPARLPRRRWTWPGAWSTLGDGEAAAARDRLAAAARPFRRRPGRLDRRGHGAPRHRLRAGLRRPRRLRRHVDHHRAGARRRGERCCRRAPCERTFERYWEFFVDRRDGEPWDAFTPYEIRTIGAFVRLGWRERARRAAGLSSSRSGAPPAGGSGPRWSSARPRDAALPRRHAAHLGGLGLRPRRCSTCSSTSSRGRRRTRRPRAGGRRCRRRGSTTGGVAVARPAHALGAAGLHACARGRARVIMVLADGLAVPPGGSGTARRRRPRPAPPSMAAPSPWRRTARWCSATCRPR